ncbi:hypothetical protein [Pseudooceanicola sp. 200-1SW]|uniref:hypothetical protein n=1 Tax=Pseudooceanicola sp. 200-1SW TaxID=3425949 RepID=UPI003D7FF165
MIDHLTDRYDQQRRAATRPTPVERLLQGLCWACVAVLVTIALLDVNTHLARRHITAGAFLGAQQ